MFPKKYFSKPFASRYFRKLLVLVAGLSGRVELLEQLLLRIIPTDVLAWFGYGAPSSWGSVRLSEESLSGQVSRESEVSSATSQLDSGNIRLTEELVWSVEE